MSQELSICYQGTGANLYCIVRKLSDGTVWNTANAALEAWADGTVADYDIALTDRGGDLYDGTMPAAIPTGDYRVYYYERAGAIPAITDLVLKSPVKHWDGTALTSSSNVTLSAYALSTLASIKRRLEITDDDSNDILTEYLNQVSAEIERVTGVNFKARDYRTWLNGAHQRELLLPHYPIQTITRIAFGAANAMTVTYSGTGIRANVSIYRDPESPDAGGMRLVSYSTTGVKTETNLSFATYGSVSTLVTAVGGLTGWTATTVSNQPSLDLHPTGGQDAKGVAVTFTYPDLDDFAYSVNYANGKVRFDVTGNGSFPFWQGGGGGHHALRMPRAFQYILAEFRAGYETIPSDVSLVCNEIVADKYFEGQFGRGVQEIKLGPGVLRLDQTEIDDIQSQLKHYIDLSNMIGEA